jgi:hypothetical protein
VASKRNRSSRKRSAVETCVEVVGCHTRVDVIWQDGKRDDDVPGACRRRPRRPPTPSRSPPPPRPPRPPPPPLARPCPPLPRTHPLAAASPSPTVPSPAAPRLPSLARPPAQLSATPRRLRRHLLRTGQAR